MSVLIKGMEMPSDKIGQCGYKNIRIWYDGTIEELNGYHVKEASYKVVPVPPHGPLIDADAFIKEINERIEAAIKWGTNAIADRNNEIKLRAEQAVATFCEASLTAKKLPTIIEAEVDDV